MSETKVKIIQPKNKESKIEETEKKLRVAAYCRVSTNSEEQATSYEAQVSYYTNYILQNPKWVAYLQMMAYQLQTPKKEMTLMH